MIATSFRPTERFYHENRGRVKALVIVFRYCVLVCNSEIQ